MTNGLHAVGTALRLPDDQVRNIIKVFAANQEEHAENLSLEACLEAVRLMVFNSQNEEQIMNVAIAPFLARIGTTRCCCISN